MASEFFEQGDIEKSELHIKPMDMMDRDKKDQLPAMQVGFIDSICLPVYQVKTAQLARQNPNALEHVPLSSFPDACWLL